ncbi:hypothetical protein [Elizabethkingia meningoseptica]|nr:hypothetical protein [Elizabethkingia meningoseptica]MCT3691026.1 hypothetical protein [Elizabethkingia anophelis]MBG0514075.1 hypothetical protein [Elizabethkingia meningoseptica]MCT3823051.1 hypothetical protein [Elizabethkingia anophelis]MCT3930369.1 hypothetical protein [Elizabethkingia anophelis]MCT4111991.1 hypothetical protein [Elizabethkingia anophelis]
MKEFISEETEKLMLALSAQPTNEPEYIGGKHRRRERRKAERKLNKKKK